MLLVQSLSAWGQHFTVCHTELVKVEERFDNPLAKQWQELKVTSTSCLQRCWMAVTQRPDRRKGHWAGDTELTSTHTQHSHRLQACSLRGDSPRRWCEDLSYLSDEIQVSTDLRDERGCNWMCYCITCQQTNTTVFVYFVTSNDI